MFSVEPLLKAVEPLLKVDQYGEGVPGLPTSDSGRSVGGSERSCGSPKAKAEEDVKTLKKAIVLTMTFMFAEILGGLIANSLAIMTDAAHLLSDVGGFIVSAFSIHLSSQGYQRADTSGALISVMITWFMVGGLLIGAVHRTIQPQAIDGKLMFIISTMGLIVNLALMKVIGHNHFHGGPGDGCGGCGCTTGAAVEIAVSRWRKQRRRREERRGEPSAVAQPAEPDNLASPVCGPCLPPPLPESLLSQPTPNIPPPLPLPLSIPPAFYTNGEESEPDNGYGHGSFRRSNGQDDVNEQNLAMRAALIHVAGDMIQSVGVMLASLLIWYQPFDLGVTSTGISKWYYADPISTILSCLVVMLTTRETAKQAMRQIMRITPAGIK